MMRGHSAEPLPVARLLDLRPTVVWQYLCPEEHRHTTCFLTHQSIIVSFLFKSVHVLVLKLVGTKAIGRKRIVVNRVAVHLVDGNTRRHAEAL